MLNNTCLICLLNGHLTVCNFNMKQVDVERLLSCVKLFFFKLPFQKILCGIPSECQTVLIWPDPNCLIIFKGYRQMTIVAISEERDV